ncbi:nucleotide-binding universal stress UspA family protein [Isoptericola jiangsuensis]|uniref:Nucleotide-binding universal stress UspA family protein n=1 Tax=Isoptericola jiangsuensis TaxID=548579 RepID=A0A2A9EZ30_9MICO|nr:universal stress protein [Isoptericola jiangsuensis]PFG43562.1 nucleotide-binding universal stress UspA family protein [Isoptericola jiangsuensis]
MGTTADRPIVVGIDGSPEASGALAYAVREAEREGCSLWLVNAVHEIVPVGPMLPLISGEPLVEVGRQLLADAQAVVDDLSDGRVAVRRQETLGPATEVLAAAGEQARLVVLGHRAASLVERMFTGSTTFGVVARAACPVVSVPRGWSPEADARRVVVAVDGSPGSPEVLAAGFAAAARRSARLEVLHCWRLDPFYSYLVDEWSVQEQWGAQAHGIIDGLVAAAAQEQPGVPYESHVEYANVADTLVRRSSGADLLVMGRHGHGAVRPRMVAAVLGSVTRTVLQHAHCPVEVVPAPSPVPPDAAEPVGGPTAGGTSS